MSNKPRVSVFMITYNHEKFISEAIEGILQQDANFIYELVIGEDYSTDKTRLICEKYAKKNKMINLLPQLSSNLGVNKNAERTFNACRGKYIAICEGDDYWTDPYKLQKQVDFLENNPDYVLVHHNAKTIDFSGILVNESNLPPANRTELSCDDLMKGKIISTLTICFRSIIKDLPDEFYHVPIPDLFLVSLLGRHGKAKYMPEIEPAMYREHSGGVWSSLNLQKRTRAKIQTWNLMAQYYKRIGENNLYDFYLKRASASYPALIKLSLQNKDFKETVEASTDFIFNNKWNEFKNILSF